MSSELIEPFLLAVDVRVARLNQISLQAVQKLIVASLISQLAASKVVDMMGVLVEMEALKVLQTLLQLVTTDTIVVKGKSSIPTAVAQITINDNSSVLTLANVRNRELSFFFFIKQHCFQLLNYIAADT